MKMQSDTEQRGSHDTSVTPESIRNDIFQYMKNSPGVTADGSTHGLTWVRWCSGEWRGVNTGGKHRLSKYVYGRVLTDDEMKEWLASNPVKLLATNNAYTHSNSDRTIWEKVERQGVFTGETRCFWCGIRESIASLTSEEAVEHGDIHLCKDCRPAWEKQDEIK